MKLLLLVVGVAVVASALAACGGDDSAADSTPTRTSGLPQSSVTVNLNNWNIEPTSPVVKAGTVSFTATHQENHGHAGDEGGATHQLFVARLNEGVKAGETKFGAPVLNLDAIKPGEKKSGEAVLEPGTYELACLVVEKVGGKDINHYQKGMYTVLTVE